MKIISFLNGKKTYILAFCTIVYAWTAVYYGTLDTQQAIDLTLAALGFSTVRHGIQTQA